MRRGRTLRKEKENGSGEGGGGEKNQRYEKKAVNQFESSLNVAFMSVHIEVIYTDQKPNNNKNKIKVIFYYTSLPTGLPTINLTI